VLARHLPKQLWRNPKIHELAAVLGIDEDVVRREVARHERALAQGGHPRRGAYEDARAPGRLEGPVRKHVRQARVWAPLERDEKATLPLADGAGPKQIRMVDRRAGRCGDPQSSPGRARGLGRLEGSDHSRLVAIPR
jgi:hypothetical protein